MKDKKTATKEAKARRGRLVLGVDLGGTKILALVIDRRGRVVGRARERTRAEEGIGPVVARIAHAARFALRRAGVTQRRIAAAGIAAPGVIDPVAGLVRTAPNLPGWQDVPLTTLLGAAVGTPFVLENDANAGALAEHHLGSGRGAGDLVAIFVGTGIGGGLVLGGRIHEGARLAAGELGHMVIAADGPPCGCGQRGCVEALAGRSAIARALRAAVVAGRRSVLAPLVSTGRAGGDMLRSSAIADAYRARDPLTAEVLAAAQAALGLLTANIVNLLDPGIVVFGGGLIEALGPRFVVGIRRAARPRFLLKDDARRVRITMARLGDDAVALGAGLAARAAAGGAGGKGSAPARSMR
jgi:glucokinase